MGGKLIWRSLKTKVIPNMGLLRRGLDRAVDLGLRYTNPAARLKRARVRPKRISLPNPDPFAALLREIRRVPYGPGLASVELVEFLAFGGFRKGEAASIRWTDVDFHRGEILVRGDAETGTKNWTIRRVPMIPDMIALLQRLRTLRPECQPKDPVMRVRECQGALTRACFGAGSLPASRYWVHPAQAGEAAEVGIV